MSKTGDKARGSGRREFLSQVSAAVAASGLGLGGAARATAAEQPAAGPLPKIKIGPHSVTRLVAGWNPIGGYSYMGPNMDQHMREYFTDEKTVAFLERCERAGINTHQFSRPERMAPIFRTLRERGSKLQYISLYSGGPGKLSAKALVEQTHPIAIVHHGGVSDRLFREGKQNQVLDFVKQAHDAGVSAGVSAHNPNVIKYIADKGWEVDLFMCCFYYVTRPEEETKKMPPVVTVPVGKPFFKSDPATMTEVMRQVDQPCLGFKILAAGRMGFKRETVRKAFAFALKNIKPTDGVIVGMYPRFRDEVRENVDYVLHHG